MSRIVNHEGLVDRFENPSTSVYFGTTSSSLRLEAFRFVLQDTYSYPSHIQYDHLVNRLVLRKGPVAPEGIPDQGVVIAPILRLLSPSLNRTLFSDVFALGPACKAGP